MSDFDIKTMEEKVEKSLHVLKEELGTVRAGRANAALVDKVTVEYYGTPTPLKALANISVPEPRTLMISPFDPKSIPEIEKAINAANIGINPVNDGKVIRLQIPQVTEERRKERRIKPDSDGKTQAGRSPKPGCCGQPLDFMTSGH